MKKLLLLLILSFFSIQSYAGSCPDGSEPVRSISDDGTYFVYNCGGSASTSSNTFEIQNPDRYCASVILSNDVASGKKYNVCLNDKTAFKEYGLQVVDKKDGHPVRAGSKSMRFELRDGDCNNPPPPDWNDCKNDRERFELSGKGIFDGEEGWYAWSIFIPMDYVDIEKGATDLGQFNLEPGEDPDPCCIFTIGKKKSGYSLEINILDSNKWVHKSVALNLSDEEMKGNWSDFLINFKWSKKEDGFIKLWLNNWLVFEHYGKNFSKDVENTYFKFGIYRSALSRYLNHKNFSPEVEACFKKNGASAEVINLTKKGEDSQVLGWGENAISFKIYNQCKHLYKIKAPTQVVYYDEVRAGKTKEEVVGKLPLRINHSKESESEVNSSKTETNEIPKVTTSDSDPTVSKVIEVIQGDKFIVEIAEPHELAGTNINLNLRDVDAPDAVKSCPKQLEFGNQVKDFVAQKIAGATSLKITNFRKTSKAIIGQVIIDGKDLGAMLIQNGYASDEYGYWKGYFCSALNAIQAGISNEINGDYEESIFWYERALIIDPDGSNNSQATYALSKLYRASGDDKKSLEYLKQSADLNYMQAEGRFR
jgi:endonuclease YncB( thermonuclease family)